MTQRFQAQLLSERKYCQVCDGVRRLLANMQYGRPAARCSGCHGLVRRLNEGEVRAIEHAQKAIAS